MLLNTYVTLMQAAPAHPYAETKTACHVQADLRLAIIEFEHRSHYRFRTRGGVLSWTEMPSATRPNAILFKRQSKTHGQSTQAQTHPYRHIMIVWLLWFDEIHPN